VSVRYDPLLFKLIVRGRREGASADGGQSDRWRVKTNPPSPRA
jgi:hypothetical protein